MNKRIHDTYTRWCEEMTALERNLSVSIEDPIARAQILAATSDSSDAVSEIIFAPITNEILRVVMQIFPDACEPAEDSYMIHVEQHRISVYANSDNAVRYAACAIRDYTESGLHLGWLYNVPLMPFRAIKTYIPGRKNVAYFRELLEMCMRYGYNTLVMEVGGAMEYKRHPEINEGWLEYCKIFQEYPGKSTDVQRCMPWLKDSIHWENGGGEWLTQNEIRALLQLSRCYGIEVIPEVPSLSHSDYLLTNHPELAENPQDPLPDTYCPSNPATYDLLFDVLEEVLEVFQPKMVHIAHDEWHTACLCPRCRDKDPGDLFAEDVNRIQAWLAHRGVETMIWGDMIVRFVDKFGGIRGAGMMVRKIPQDRFVTIRGKQYRCYREVWGKTALEMEEGTLYCAPDSQSALHKLHKDVWIMNWLHHYDLTTDSMYTDAGFRCVIGNFLPRNFEDWKGTPGRGIQGVSISNWGMLDSRHMQRNIILFYMAYASAMLWDRAFREEDHEENMLRVAADLYRYHYRGLLNSPRAEIVHAATVSIPHAMFVDGNCIDEDHDRMGWYRVEYTDGTLKEIPIIWGLNIGIQESWSPQKTFLGYDDVSFLEPTYTCDLRIYDNATWYCLPIPLEKQVKSITPVLLDEYRDAIKIRSIEIID